MSTEKYNTNLAAEYYVLSVLHRLGAEANLTLGNKKAVDIVVVRDAGDAVTVDVKGLAGKSCWPVDNIKMNQGNHFIVLVCFKDKIKDLSVVPEIYVVPSDKLEQFIYEAPRSKRRVVNLSRMRKNDAEQYQNAWNLVLRRR